MLLSQAQKQKIAAFPRRNLGCPLVKKKKKKKREKLERSKPIDIRPVGDLILSFHFLFTIFQNIELNQAKQKQQKKHQQQRRIIHLNDYLKKKTPR